MQYVSVNLQEILAFTTQTVGVNDYTGCSPYRVSVHCAYNGICLRIQAFCAVKLMCSGTRQKGRVYLITLCGYAADGSGSCLGALPVLGRAQYWLIVFRIFIMSSYVLRVTSHCHFRTYFT